MKTLVFALALASVLAAAVGAEGATRTDQAKNGEIAFSAAVHGVSQVFTVKPNGTGLRQITQGSTEAGLYGLSWAPDGTHLLYSVTPNGVDEIARSLVDGSDVSVLSPPCTGCFSDSDPTYSPDGTKIAFDRGFLPFDHPSAIPIFTMNADGSGLTQLTPKSASTFYFGPQWSPNGKWIAFVASSVARNLNAIEVMHADGSDVRRLTPFRLDANNPHWSPDGKLILFNADHGGGQGISTNLFTMHPDGTHRVALTHFTGGFLQAFAEAWSPDGRHVLYQRSRFSGTDTSVGDFYITDSHGRHQRRLTFMHVTADARAAWGTSPG